MIKKDDLYKKIRDLITYGDLHPGEKVKDTQLSKEIGCSRTPIREALRQLESEGYITLIPNKGAFVSKISPRDVEEIYDITVVMEGYATFMMVKNIKSLEKKYSQIIKELKKKNEEMKSFAKDNKYRKYLDKNTEFHSIIAESSENKNLSKLILTLRRRIWRYRFTAATIPGHIDQYIIEHDEIIEAVAEKNASLAQRKMEQHIEHIKQNLISLLTQYPNF